MPRYYIDTEFIEKVKKDWRGRKYHWQQLISIGIVCEDGRSYYAINKEFSRKEASKWVVDNVLSKLPTRNPQPEDSPRERQEARAWKSLEQIQWEVAKFFGCWRDGQLYYRAPEDIEVWAYYADYDWVMLCSLFGAMIDLPKGFPMYCRDLKQLMDEKGLSKEWKRDNCPDPEGAHNALVDAKWNMKLHKTIETHEENSNRV